MRRTSNHPAFIVALVLALSSASGASADTLLLPYLGRDVIIGTVYKIPALWKPAPQIVALDRAVDCGSLGTSYLAQDGLYATRMKNPVSSEAWVAARSGSPGVTITVVSSTINFCNFQIGPPVFPGSLTIWGSESDDTIVNTAVSRVKMHGGGGNDTMWNTFSRAWDSTFGESGSDLFILDHDEWATGEQDGDLFCVFPEVRAGTVNGDGVDWDGGPDTNSGAVDLLCGRAANAKFIELQDPNCSCF